MFTKHFGTGAALVFFAMQGVGSVPAVAACRSSATNVHIPSYDTRSSSAVYTSSQVHITCDDSENAVISLSAGLGNFNNRQMKDNGFGLSYNLYLDQGYTRVWGDGTAGTSTLSSMAGDAANGMARSYFFYVKIAGNQNPPAGTYQDSLILTISY